jgi:hypothetical protein
MQTQTKKKEKGICDIFGCENEATVRGQTLRFCYEHYSKITANDGSDSTIENETFYIGSHKIKKVPEYLIRLELEGDLLKEFEAVKKYYGLKENENVIRKLIAEVYEDMPCGTIK